MSPSKIRLKTVTAKAELIREMLAAIETLPLASETEFSADVRMMAAGESFLRRSLEGLLDLGRHVLSKGFGKVVPDYASVADELAAQGILPPEVAAKLRLMARYRNRMVHFYDDILPGELYKILVGNRGDVEEVLAAIQGWLAAHPEIRDEEL
ncbi:MAG TPA: HepT-like ribonuclease domain-containing protein [Thermoanaerobaculia bacterium]|nr:HepT-like ribonuclease domain-containing protein [Thermoanaerobaculia bacterium]